MTADKMSLVFSNVPGPRNPVNYNGSDTNKFAFFVPALGKLCSGIGLISHRNQVKLTVWSDTSGIQDVPALAGIIDKNYDKYVLGHKM